MQILSKHASPPLVFVTAPRLSPPHPIASPRTTPTPPYLRVPHPWRSFCAKDGLLGSDVSTLSSSSFPLFRRPRKNPTKPTGTPTCGANHQQSQCNPNSITHLVIQPRCPLSNPPNRHHPRKHRPARPYHPIPTRAAEQHQTRHRHRHDNQLHRLNPQVERKYAHHQGPAAQPQLPEHTGKCQPMDQSKKDRNPRFPPRKKRTQRMSCGHKYRNRDEHFNRPARHPH